MSDRTVTETALLGVFFGVAVGFVALTTTFRSSSAAQFPRLTAAVIVVGVLLLLAEDRLPESVRRIVAEPVDLVDRDDLERIDTGRSDETTADAPTAETADGLSADRPLSARQFLYAAIAAYVGFAYVVSILVATPFFVLVYGYWNRHRRIVTAGLLALSVAICAVFIWLANAPLDRGLLFPRGIF
ncbi:hypothetical protein ACNS7O_17815 (plasmid) [Haloferacaceae archaeon DSL9]